MKSQSHAEVKIRIVVFLSDEEGSVLGALFIIHLPVFSSL